MHHARISRKPRIIESLFPPRPAGTLKHKHSLPIAAMKGKIQSGQVGRDFGHADRMLDFPPRFWTLDPIDGTKGFLRREQYAICLGLVEKGTVTAAAMGCPNLPASYAEGETGPAGVLLSGYRGGGSYSQPMPAGCGASGAAKGEKTRMQIKVCVWVCVCVCLSHVYIF